MQNKELTRSVLELLRENKTQKEIAFELRRHRNTIARYVKYIRDQYVYDIHEIVNKIDDRLNKMINQMTVPQLLTYRHELVPPSTPLPTLDTEDMLVSWLEHAPEINND